jgi:predicted O-methyltransferase YrrM
MEAENALMRSLPMEEGMRRRDEFLLAVGEETATFLHALATSARPKVMLEIGTSYGYSTVWLAAAARASGSRLISLELDPEKARFAAQQIEAAGLAAVVEIRIGDALELLKSAPETFDFVLLDLWKELYVPCFDLFLPKLNPGAWVIADNMIHPPFDQAQAAVYRKRVRETNAFDTLLMPIGSGIEVSYRRSDGAG